MFVSIGNDVMCSELPFSAVVVTNSDEVEIFRSSELQLEVQLDHYEFPTNGPIRKIFIPYASFQQDDQTTVFFYRGSMQTFRSGLYRVSPLLSEDNIRFPEVELWLLDQDSFWEKGKLENEEPFDSKPTLLGDQAIVQIQQSFSNWRLRRPWFEYAPPQLIYSRDWEGTVVEMQRYSYVPESWSISAARIEYVAEGLARDYIYLSHMGLARWNPYREGARTLTNLEFLWSDDQHFEVTMTLQLSSPMSEEYWKAFEQYSNSAQMARFGEDSFRFKFQQDQDGVVSISVTFLEEGRRSEVESGLQMAR